MSRKRPCTKARQAAGTCLTVVQKARKKKWLKHERAEARSQKKMSAASAEAAEAAKFNPRGIAWSGCVARPKRYKSKASKTRVRMVRYAAGRRPSAFAWSSLIGRHAAGKLLKRCRKAKFGRKCSAMKRSVVKRSRKCARRGRRGRVRQLGMMRCFVARGKRVCFKTKR